MRSLEASGTPELIAAIADLLAQEVVRGFERGEREDRLARRIWLGLQAFSGTVGARCPQLIQEALRIAAAGRTRQRGRRTKRSP